MEDEKNLIVERAGAEADLAEAMRMTNNAIRRVHRLGLTVKASQLTMHTYDGPVPQINFCTVKRAARADKDGAG
jgi:hypothetical protein